MVMKVGDLGKGAVMEILLCWRHETTHRGWRKYVAIPIRGVAVCLMYDRVVNGLEEQASMGCRSRA
jgi:hypothetical protein